MSHSVSPKNRKIAKLRIGRTLEETSNQAFWTAKATLIKQCAQPHLAKDRNKRRVSFNARYPTKEKISFAKWERLGVVCLLVSDAVVIWRAGPVFQQS